MKLTEIATQVKVVDQEKPYFYWVTVAKPEKIMANAIAKHRKAMGTTPERENALIASIVDKKAS